MYSPYAIISCGYPYVLRNDKIDILYDVQFWIWPDGCASAAYNPKNELARCYYKCHRYTNSDIDCWHDRDERGHETIKIRDGVLVNFDIFRSAGGVFSDEETNIKLIGQYPCNIDTKVSAEPLYPYKNISIIL